MRLSDLQQRMDAGATLLVPNQRAARGWRRRLFDPATSSVSPNVLPLSAWTAAQWQTVLVEGHDDRILLNPQQEAELWTRALEAARFGTLLPTRSLVRLCLAAQHLVHSYGAAGKLLTYRGEPGTDTALFAECFRAHTDRCAGARFLPPSALDAALAKHFSSGTGHAPHTLLLLGFDRLSPSQHDLMDTLQAAGSYVEILDAAEVADVRPERGTLLRCADAQQEWLTIAHDLRQQVTAGGNTGKSVLLVLPDEDASRAALDRSLRTCLGEDRGPRWEFATGRSLASLPLTATALQLLRWATAPLETGQVGELLQSPYLDLGVAPDAAGELDAEMLRRARRLKPEWSIDALRRAVYARARGLSAALQRVEHAADRMSKGKHLPSAWAEAVREVLSAAGWPGKRERTSEEFQLLDRWQEMVESVASLDLFDTPMSFADFFERLEAAADETLFARENIGAPIQIVSPSEAAGTVADMMWFAHATEATWSARRMPSPLLPWPLQQSCGMPGTDATADLEAHRQTTERLLHSGSSVVLTYAATNADGECRPAAVLAQFPELQRLPSPALPQEPHQIELEEVIDDAPLPALPPGNVSGGVAVLKDQAACGFRAFAERRLFATEPEEAVLGLDARERGDLLHRVLQLFWADIGSQQQLLRLQAQGQLAETLRRHIDVALSISGSDRWDGAYLQLQRDRLHSLLMRWLEMEALRPPFRVVHTEHEVRDVQVGPLQFNLRVDRIDEVGSAAEPTLALLDYKTGSPQTSEWLGERPDEPQLPVYAVAAELEYVGAIAFATVRPGSKQLGLRAFPAKSDLLFAGGRAAPEEFEAQMETWHATVTRLAEEFAAGDTRVDPKQYPATCTHCGQRMLCRLNPDLLQETSLEEEKAEAMAD